LREKVDDMGGSQDAIWEFLLGGHALGYFVLGCCAAFGVLLCTLVFQAACALADVDAPNFLYSLVLVLLTLAVCGPLVWGIVYLYKQTPLYRWSSGWGSFTVLALVGFLLCVAVSSALYVPLLRVSLKKGLLTGLFEQLLTLLLGLLLFGAFSVILAVVQMGWAGLLFVIAVVFAGAVALWLYIIYFLYSDATARRQNGLVWALIGFFFPVPGLIVWLCVRPHT
jgi:hypothetical protein